MLPAPNELARNVAVLNDEVGAVLLDGAKALYPEILSLVASRRRPGALIVADDADYSPVSVRVG